MLKQVVLMIFFAMNVATVVSAALLEDEAGHQIKPINLEAYLHLKTAPEEGIKKLYGNKALIKEQLRKLYLIQTVAELSRQQGLADSDYEKQELQHLIDKYYFTAKLKQLSQHQLPDFEPLAKVHYQAHKEQYKIPRQIDVSHIMLTEEKHNETEILVLMKEIKKKLKQGEDFSRLADEYSEDPTVKNNHGHIGRFAENRLVKVFAEAAFKLKAGEVSDPVKTKYGYHLIKLIQHYPAKYPAFAEVKDKIMAQLKQQYIADKREEYFDQIISRNKMHFNDKAIESYIHKKLQEYQTDTDTLNK